MSRIRLDFDNKVIFYQETMTMKDIFKEIKLYWAENVGMYKIPTPMVAVRNALSEEVSAKLVDGWSVQFEVQPKRKSWDTFYMELAHSIAEMCTCAAGRKVGAVFVKDKRILTTGFNGVPAGYPHPNVCVRKQQGVPSGQGLEMCGCAHAEANGIANAARVGLSLHESTLYCTTEPCSICMGALANVGVSRVVYKAPYHHEMSAKIASYAGILVEQMVESSEVE